MWIEATVTCQAIASAVSHLLVVDGKNFVCYGHNSEPVFAGDVAKASHALLIDVSAGTGVPTLTTFAPDTRPRQNHLAI